MSLFKTSKIKAVCDDTAVLPSFLASSRKISTIQHPRAEPDSVVLYCAMEAAGFAFLMLHPWGRRWLLDLIYQSDQYRHSSSCEQMLQVFPFLCPPSDHPCNLCTLKLFVLLFISKVDWERKRTLDRGTCDLSPTLSSPRVDMDYIYRKLKRTNKHLDQPPVWGSLDKVTFPSSSTAEQLAPTITAPQSVQGEREEEKDIRTDEIRDLGGKVEIF